MFALMDRCFAGVIRDRFEADLAEKQWIILLEKAATETAPATLCGFSTQMLLTVQAGDRPVTALFSGDTIIAPEHWGDAALSHVWGNLALALIDEHQGRELYWFLISKGYKTYRFLPVFFHSFYPRRNLPTPNAMRQVIDALAHAKFPGKYDAASGLIRADASKDRLRAGVADVTPERLRDPDIQFFVQTNPGYSRGDELCCLAPLTRENFTPAAYRVIHAGRTS